MPNVEQTLGKMFKGLEAAGGIALMERHVLEVNAALERHDYERVSHGLADLAFDIYSLTFTEGRAGTAVETANSIAEVLISAYRHDESVKFHIEDYLIHHPIDRIAEGITHVLEPILLEDGPRLNAPAERMDAQLQNRADATAPLPEQDRAPTAVHSGTPQGPDGAQVASLPYHEITSTPHDPDTSMPDGTVAHSGPHDGHEDQIDSLPHDQPTSASHDDGHSASLPHDQPGSTPHDANTTLPDGSVAQSGPQPGHDHDGASVPQAQATFTPHDSPPVSLPHDQPASTPQDGPAASLPHDQPPSTPYDAGTSLDAGVAHSGPTALPVDQVPASVNHSVDSSKHDVDMDKRSPQEIQQQYHAYHDFVQQQHHSDSHH